MGVIVGAVHPIDTINGNGLPTNTKWLPHKEKNNLPKADAPAIKAATIIVLMVGRDDRCRCRIPARCTSRAPIPIPRGASRRRVGEHTGVLVVVVGRHPRS